MQVKSLTRSSVNLQSASLTGLSSENNSENPEIVCRGDVMESSVDGANAAAWSTNKRRRSESHSRVGQVSRRDHYCSNRGSL